MPGSLSESQAADVLRRAALLQAQSVPADGVGLSPDEVRRAAEAAGIEARYVDQALAGAGDQAAPSPPFLGIETAAERSRVVPGSVSEHEWGRMVLALRREFGADGTAETLGGVRTWAAGQTRVQLEADGPNTRIVVSSRWASDAKVPVYAAGGYALFAAILAGAGAVGSDPAGAWLAVAMVVLAVLHVGYVFGPVRRRARTRGPQLDRALAAVARLALTDERAGALADGEPDALPEPEVEALPEPWLDPSLLDVTESTGEPEVPQRSSSTRLRS